MKVILVVLFIGITLALDQGLCQYNRKNTSSFVATSSPDHNFPDDDSVRLYWAAEWYAGSDYRMALDTMRLYVELHPYATVYPGEVLSGISSTVGYVAQIPSEPDIKKWIEEYNWLLKVMPANPEPAYQSTIIQNLAFSLVHIDHNEAANMWYNYSLLFKSQTDQTIAWRNINAIRYYQTLIPEDTSEFHVLTFPLQPILGVSGGHPAEASGMDVSITPNPVSDKTTITITVPSRESVVVSLYDNLGRAIRTINSSAFDVGTHQLELTVGDLSQGTYYLRVQRGKEVITKMLVIEH